MVNPIEFKKAASNETYFIAQSSDRPKEDMAEEEKHIAVKLGAQVDFSAGHGVYTLRDEAIAVARMLLSANPARHLAVIAQRVDKEKH